MNKYILILIFIFSLSTSYNLNANNNEEIKNEFEDRINNLKKEEYNQFIHNTIKDLKSLFNKDILDQEIDFETKKSEIENNYKNNLLFNLPKEMEELEAEIIASNLDEEIVEELIVTIKDIEFNLTNTGEVDDLINKINLKIDSSNKEIESLKTKNAILLASNKEIESLKTINTILLSTLIIIIIGINVVIVLFIIRKSNREDSLLSNNTNLLQNKKN